MTRKQAVIALAAGALVLVACGVWSVLTYQPAFYRAELANPATTEQRLKQAKPFTQAVVQLVDRALRDERWSQQFSEQSVNSWLAAELPEHYAQWLPSGVEQPRIRFEDELVRVAFRTRRGPWSGVISARLRVWVPAPNQLACEIEQLLAGLVPLPAEALLNDLVEDLNRARWSVEWRPSENADVLLVHFGRSTPDAEPGAIPTLETVELGRGRLRITGGMQPGAAGGTRAPEAVSQAEDDSESGWK
ncbi:MAG: hypothetical protein ACT4QC_02775 [Planctomycetaceae bacterium]